MLGKFGVWGVQNPEIFITHMLISHSAHVLLYVTTTGEPVIAPFKDIRAIFLATAVWYLIFYSPFDLTYKICKLLPFYCVLGVAKELTRVKKVHDGVVHAQHAYPDSSAMLIWIIIGTAKGAGSGIIRFVERFMRGTWNPGSHELLLPTFQTKASIIGALVFSLEGRTEYLTQPHSLVYAGVAIFFVWSKLIYLIFHLVDPMLPLENLFCAIFMGGIWDAFSRALSSVGRPNLLGGGGKVVGAGGAATSALAAVDTTVLNGVAGKEIKSE